MNCYIVTSLLHSHARIVSSRPNLEIGLISNVLKACLLRIEAMLCRLVLRLDLSNTAIMAWPRDVKL